MPLAPTMLINGFMVATYSTGRKSFQEYNWSAKTFYASGAGMTGKIFMSYSRRELGFVDDLVSQLEQKGYDVWLDYRVLIPGSPWKEQIDKGLDESDTVLLVISKASISSQYVELEWRHFLDMKKRMILLIFEAVDLPEELEKFEWVDFRGSYQAGLDELFSQLEKPIQEEHPVPETGFKAPLVIWATIALSIVVAFISLGTFWTIFIPFTLIPLPYQIYKRSFDFMRVQASLVALPIALILGQFVYFEDVVLNDALMYGLGLGLFAWGLLALLRSPALQRWGKPEATVPKFATLYNQTSTNVKPVPFFIDHAPQDSKIADEISTTLKSYGHPQADSIQSAKAVLALVSRFKNDTEADPVKQVVFPVMIQGNDNISQKLSKVQWIDFRPGVKGLHILAQLLPNPTALLKALGMRPVSSLSVYPPMITTLLYLVILLAAVNLGAVIDYLFFAGITNFLDSESIALFFTILIGSLIVFVTLSFFLAKGLITRTGLFANIYFFLVGLVMQGLLMYGIFRFDNYVFDILEEIGVNAGYTFTYFGTGIYIGGILLLAIIYLRNRLDIKRWFPTPIK